MPGENLVEIALHDLVESRGAARHQAGAEQQPGDADDAERLAVRHRVADERRRDDQQVEPRLRQGDEIPRPRARAAHHRRVRAHGRTPTIPRSGVSVNWWIGWTRRSNPQRRLRSVSSSDVRPLSHTTAIAAAQGLTLLRHFCDFGPRP